MRASNLEHNGEKIIGAMREKCSRITFSCSGGRLRCSHELHHLRGDNWMDHTHESSETIRMLAKPISRDRSARQGWMDWARELMAAEGVSQKDVARSWEVSESSISRWLDGLQTSDISLRRAVVFSHLVRRPLEEIAARLGHDVWSSEGVPRVQPLTSPGKPPVPTTSLEPAGREGWFFLLLHLELRAADVAAIIATLDKQGKQGDDSRRVRDTIGETL